MSALTALANESVDVEPHTGEDDFGTPTFGASVTYSGVRVQDEGELIRDQDGNEVQSSGVLYVLGQDATSDFNPQAEVTLPSGEVETVMKSAHQQLGTTLELTKVWY